MPPAGGEEQEVFWGSRPSRGRSSIAARGEIRDDGCGQRVLEGDADAAGEFPQEGLDPDDDAEQAQGQVPAQAERQADAGP